MTQDFDGVLLRSFVEAVSAGSMGQAARKLGQSQPTTTMHIRRLEDILGCQLLLRTPRGVVPTDKGREFLSYAQRILDVGQQAYAQIAKNKGTKLEKVRIRISEDIAGESVLQHFLNDDFSPLPLEIDVVSIEETPTPSDFFEGKVQIFIGEPSAPLSEKLEPTRVKLMHLQWVSAPGFDFRHRPLPVALYPSICAWHNPIVRALDSALIDWYLAFESKSLSALLAAARTGSAMIACLPPVIGKDLKALDHQAESFPPPPEIELAFYSHFGNSDMSAEYAILEKKLWDLIAG